MLKLKDIQKIYFIGVGGIGMSALARYFNQNGKEVFGYDKIETSLTRKLVKEGIEIHYKDDVTQIPKNIDLVVFTPAVPSTHAELTYFRTNGFPVKKRAEVLGLISKEKQTIAIAGTHGKTSTCSILTYLLKVGGIDCTAFLGGIAYNFGSNYIAGQSDWVVVEADEYDRSFLHLHPKIATVLSMDADHLDIYGSAKKVEESFNQFVAKVKKNGLVFYKNNLPLKVKKEAYTYGLDEATYCATNIRVEDGFFVFDYKSPLENINKIRFALPGHHNIENATVAIAIAQQLGIKAAAIKEAMLTFKGIKRRFETICRTDKVVYIDDYAHHPTELNAAINAARTLFPKRKITGVFQPHLFSRTKDFAKGFAAALDELDEIILLDIYPARELPIAGVSSAIILDQMKNKKKVLLHKPELMQRLSEMNLDVLLTLGAGDINTFVEPIKKMLVNE